MPLFKASVYQHHAGVWFLCQTFGEAAAPGCRPCEPVDQPSAELAAEHAVNRAIDLQAIKVMGDGSVMVRILLRPFLKPGEIAPFDFLMYDTYIWVRCEQLTHTSVAAHRDMKIMSPAFHSPEPEAAPLAHLLSADGSGEAWCGAWIADEQARADHPVGGTPEAAARVTCPRCVNQRLVHLEELAMVGRYLDLLRSKGWSVAVHNDYKLDGQPHTFWLFTKGETAWKGEGRTDLEALQQLVDRLPGEMAPAPERSPLLCEHANENPSVCPCAEDCYCKARTCAGKPPNAINAAPQPLAAPTWAGIHVLNSEDAWLRIVADAKSRAKKSARAAGEQVYEKHEAKGLAEAVRAGIEKAASETKTPTVGHPILKRLDDLIRVMRRGAWLDTEVVTDAISTVSARLDAIESTLRIRKS